jgi:hypothetical protein
MTLNIKELRVGNYILPSSFYVGPYYGSPKMVTPVLLVDMYRDIAVVMQYDPIPLTDEELKNLGFELEPRGLLKSNGDLFIKATLSEDFWVWKGKGNTVLHPSCKEPIDSLHQLQNLYFVLMGREMPLY